MNSLVEKISDAEAEVMKVLWEAGEPLAYAVIRTTLQERDGKWESATINTLMNRLVKKGALKQEKREVFYYTPLICEQAYTEYKTKAFLKKIYGGNARNLLSALVNYEEVTREDLDELRRYLRQSGDDSE